MAASGILTVLVLGDHAEFLHTGAAVLVLATAAENKSGTVHQVAVRAPVLQVMVVAAKPEEQVWL